MSPFTYAHKINEPILLIHGEADNNSGTFPIQSERLFQAIKGNGGTARLVMLPHESHGYRARESVLHVLAEMFDWADRYVKNHVGIKRCAAIGDDAKAGAVGSGLPGSGDRAGQCSSLPARPAAEDAIGAGQGKPGDHRGFERQGAQVFGLEVVDVALAAGAGQDLDLGGQGVEEVGDALGGLRRLRGGR